MNIITKIVKKKFLGTVLFLLSGLLGASCLSIQSQSTRKPSEAELPAGAYLFEEFRFATERLACTEPRWDGVFFLPRPHFTKENLDRVCRWYANKHPDYSDNLRLYIYWDEEEMKKAYAEDGKMFKDRPYRAWYERCFLENVSGEVDEHYMYSSDPNDINAKRTVILSGINRFSSKELIKKWKQKQGNWKIESKLYIVNAESSSFYYSFFSGEESDTEDYRLLRFMTIRQESRDLNPQANITFINQKIAYVFLGWKYAVTVDGGKNWQVWNAQRELLDKFCCNSSDQIQKVKIGAAGEGEMEFSQTKEGKQKLYSLYTTDYGQHWFMK